MRKIVEIIEEKSEIKDNVVKLTASYLKDLIKNRGYINVLKDYQIPEDFILENTYLFDKKAVMESLALSEEFIIEAIEIEYFNKEDLKDLSMRTYSQLSKSFLKLYSDNIDWNKMMLYLLSADKILDMQKYVTLIEKYNLWKTISISGNLTTDFIREYKDKLDWKTLSIVQEFKGDEIIEFSDYIVDIRSNPEFEENKIFYTTIDDISDLITRVVRRRDHQTKFL